MKNAMMKMTENDYLDDVFFSCFFFFLREGGADIVAATVKS